MRILVFGDENFSFANGILEKHDDDIVEFCSCLKENELKQEYKNNIDNLKKNVVIHYGINPVQLKSRFPPDTYDMLYYILPGLSFHGHPEFIDPRTDMFKLRLHLFCFSFLKSSRNVVKEGGLVYILFPLESSGEANLVEGVETSSQLPFLPIDPDKLAKFCKIQRDKSKDFDLDLSQHAGWTPVLFTVPMMNQLPEWLKMCRYFCFKMSDIEPEVKSPQSVGYEESAEKESVEKEEKEGTPIEKQETKEGKDKQDADEYNVLKIPPQVFDYPIEQLSHVNECFLFKLYSVNSKSVLISRLTLKYDPRISGWKGDNKGKKDNLNMNANMMNINNMNNMNLNKFKPNKFKAKMGKNDYSQMNKSNPMQPNLMQNNMNFPMNKKANMNYPPPPPSTMNVNPNAMNLPNHNMNFKQNGFSFVGNYKNPPNTLSQNNMAPMDMNVTMNPNIPNTMMHPYINGNNSTSFRNIYQTGIPMPPPMNTMYPNHIQDKRKNNMYGSNMERNMDNYNMRDQNRMDDNNCNCNKLTYY